jgi:hypothetical protein
LYGFILDLQGTKEDTYLGMMNNLPCKIKSEKYLE